MIVESQCRGFRCVHFLTRVGIAKVKSSLLLETTREIDNLLEYINVKEGKRVLWSDNNQDRVTGRS